MGTAIRRKNFSILPYSVYTWVREDPAGAGYPINFEYDKMISIPVDVGGITVGGGAGSRQSMTNTDTTDVEATVKQIAELARAGSEIVRIT